MWSHILNAGHICKQCVTQCGPNFYNFAFSNCCTTKSQLISKCLFCMYLQFSQKTNKISTSLLKWLLMLNCFHSSFGRIKATKKTFRNWLTFKISQNVRPSIDDFCDLLLFFYIRFWHQFPQILKKVAY